MHGPWSCAQHKVSLVLTFLQMMSMLVFPLRVRFKSPDSIEPFKGMFKHFLLFLLNICYLEITRGL